MSPGGFPPLSLAVISFNGEERIGGRPASVRGLVREIGDF